MSYRVKVGLGLIASCALIGVGVYSISWVSSPEERSKPRLAVTAPSVAHILHSLIQNGGCHIELHLLGSMAGGHHMELTPQSVSMLNRSKALILVGAFFDDWLIPRLGNLQYQRLDQLGALKSFPAKEVSHYASHLDPHFWLDPRQVVNLLNPLNRFLMKVFGALCDEAILTENRHKLQAKLKANERVLNVFREQLDGVQVIATHDAFRYFVGYLNDHGINIKYQPIEFHLVGARQLIETVMKLQSSHPPEIWDAPPYSVCRDDRLPQNVKCTEVNPTGRWDEQPRGYAHFWETFLSTFQTKRYN